MFAFAATLLAGEVTGFACAAVASIWNGLAGTAAVAFLAAWGWQVPRLGGIALFTLGFLLALRTEAALQRLVDERSGLYGTPAPLELRVMETAHVEQTKKGGWRVEFPSQLGVLPVKVTMGCAKPPAVLPQAGEVWQVEGALAFARDPAKRFARRTFWASKRHPPRRLRAAPAGLSWQAVNDELARRAGAGLDWCRGLAALNRAILLGRRADLSPEKKQVFVDAGTIHVFAISGLHVMVVAWLLSTFLTRLDVPARYRALVSVPLVVAYVVLTGLRPSAVRAAFMATIWLLAPVFARRSDALTAWSITALVVYGYAPERIFDLGCALSFTVMFGIVLWLKWAKRFRPLIVFEPESNAAKFEAGLGISLAAWIAGVPLMAHVCGRFTPGGLLANAVVVVCANLLVKVGASALAVSFICLPLAAILNNVTALLTGTMDFVSTCVAALPFSNFTVDPWSIPVCLLWYAVWCAVFFFLGKILPRKAEDVRTWWK